MGTGEDKSVDIEDVLPQCQVEKKFLNIIEEKVTQKDIKIDESVEVVPQIPIDVTSANAIHSSEECLKKELTTIKEQGTLQGIVEEFQLKVKGKIDNDDEIIRTQLEKHIIQKSRTEEDLNIVDSKPSTSLDIEISSSSTWSKYYNCFFLCCYLLLSRFFLCSTSQNF